MSTTTIWRVAASRYAILLFLACGVVACTRPEPDQPAPQQELPVITRFEVPPSEAGRLTITAGVLRFVPCGASGDGEPLGDTPSGEAAQILKSFDAAASGVTAMIRREGPRLVDVRYAGLEGPTCDQLPPEGEIEARGNEPFWNMSVFGAARLRTPDAISGIEYTGTWTRMGERRWVYDAERPTNTGSEAMKLDLTETRCSDSMSGAWYPFRVVLTIGTQPPVEGCGLEGRQAIRR